MRLPFGIGAIERHVVGGRVQLAVTADPLRLDLHHEDRIGGSAHSRQGDILSLLS
jgi:hypothetical protein